MIYIEAKSIPQNEHRYDTAGDFLTIDGIRQVRTSDFGNEDYEFLILLHEMIEQHLCNKRGITDNSIDAFDIKFEKDRPEGNNEEPGDDVSAPYYHEHQFATVIERIMCYELGIDWNEYNKDIVCAY